MKQIIQSLNSYINALCSIILVPHSDFLECDQIITEIVKNGKKKVFEFHNALGSVNFSTKTPIASIDSQKTLLDFLISVDEEIRLDENKKDFLIILKDIDTELQNPQVLSMLRRIAESNMSEDFYNATIFILSHQITIPPSLEHLITVFELPIPKIKEIKNLLKEFISAYKTNELDENTLDDLALSLKGLTHFQIKQILYLAYQAKGDIDLSSKDLILKQKRQFIKKSGMLEIIEVKETMNDLGGLRGLKEWLADKAKIIKNLDKALKTGVDIPKGVLIVGLPGCGKSLTAKITSKLFEIPLIRLDVGRLLGKYIGESEANMQKALRLCEEINPCVLWVDEIEKAFAGMRNGNGHEVTIRLFGQFLTWLQEKSNTVFVVATANDLGGMPPEFLRKGRFDEIFYVGLPNFEERKEILNLHLSKRGACNIDTFELAQKSEGYCGADLEAIVKESFEEAFINGEEINDEILQHRLKMTKSISEILKDKIENLKKEIEKMHIKDASKSLERRENSQKKQIKDIEEENKKIIQSASFRSLWYDPLNWGQRN